MKKIILLALTALMMLGVVVGTFLVAAKTIIFVLEDHPTAMDVYRGETTLEITYKDGIPVDSIVVFKNKKHD